MYLQHLRKGTGSSTYFTKAAKYVYADPASHYTIYNRQEVEASVFVTVHNTFNYFVITLSELFRQRKDKQCCRLGLTQHTSQQ